MTFNEGIDNDGGRGAKREMHVVSSTDPQGVARERAVQDLEEGCLADTQALSASCILGDTPKCGCGTPMSAACRRSLNRDGQGQWGGRSGKGAGEAGARDGISALAPRIRLLR